MATIKAIEAKSIHQIQSGQVIVDLCSVAKELVENSLDAGATSIEVRFKNNGLDSIEVQDNGSGISPANYDNVALKHFTSKLSNYDDLSNLQTFGFRGEALSSLCALSKFYMTTAQADEAPKGKRLEFDTLGRLTSTNIVACQKGTTVTVEGLFESLPVRRKELTKNVKREYGKVLGLLQAYACICVNVKFTVKNAMPKAKSMTVFSTQANASTRENIANVYGAKTLAALIPIDLNLDFQPTLTQLGRKDKSNSEIHVRGHISKPVFGEGRQTPDRQMFFVNGRPCGLPQIAKAINEVYKSFNVSQSPFVFADFQMDTNAYDVNVSPDKRTILLHDAAVLVENLKTALNDMFEQQDQTIPQSQLQTPRLPAFQKLNFHSRPPSDSPESESRQRSVRERFLLRDDDSIDHGTESGDGDGPASLLREHFRNFTSTRDESEVHGKMQESLRKDQERRAEKVARKIAEQEAKFGERDEYDDIRGNQETTPTQETQQSQDDPVKIHVRDFNKRMAEQGSRSADNSHSASPSDVEMGSGSRSLSQQASKEDKGVVPNAFDRMRPKRVPAEIATVIVGDKTITTVIGSQLPRFPETKGKRNGQGGETPSAAQRTKSAAAFQFSQKLRNFGAQSAPDEEGDFEIRTQQTDSAEDDSEEVEDSRASNQDAPSKQINVDEDEVEKDVGTPKEDLDNGSDPDYVDEEEKKKIEEARVAELIRIAEESSALPTKENLKRATKALSGGRIKDSTTSLLTAIDFSMGSVTLDMRQLTDMRMATETLRVQQDYNPVAQDPEAQLSLTVSKGDFADMGIVGQFNLGFILAVRAASEGGNGMSKSKRDELFIVDQHASDEKYNFERLQAETVVGNQRLVQPVTLDLTAVEEEIVLENNDALEKNGFVVEIDTSGESVVGRRCRLVSLPLSKEVVFNTRDLEELIQLLAEAPGLGTQSRHDVPRPGKVRKMFAMRACRSSIMIGKTLSRKQMEKVVSHMGTIDKPWNCPHGRPTMRHLCSLNTLEPWMEGDEGDGDASVSLGEALQRYATE
ncbi:ATP-binding mismatch repair protein [Exophiala xenobiotica]|nr:ATP-binding mismatch repair protein [Exophiala xenobiotica]KAK5234588.1 ATP-binding mismatch repair protein [Exophiala xenobiotica]KAK5254093.1 ATP-binding mismatch repair protein [Exophiala xenobiotica]KAK5261190.1 ATP-binding mismatch repair protein [Exophiala xenobiotica]KAK5352053.1 ATP-binding mismatch repair protein [Exophiala xenobiotica]